MNKIYTEPDFEIVNVRLTSDVLFVSTESTEETIEPTGSDFPDWDFEVWLVIPPQLNRCGGTDKG